MFIESLILLSVGNCRVNIGLNDRNKTSAGLFRNWNIAIRIRQSFQPVTTQRRALTILKKKTMKRINACYQFLLFPPCFLSFCNYFLLSPRCTPNFYRKSNSRVPVTFILFSPNTIDLDKTEISSYGKELN